MFALVAMGYMWAQMAQAALKKLETGAGGRDDFYESKLVTARFFFARMLPESDARFKAVMAGADSVMTLKAASF